MQFDKVKTLKFDFNRIQLKKKEKARLPKWFKYFSLFIGVQSILLGYNIFLVKENIIEKTKETEHAFIIYKNLTEALKKGNDEQAINSFIKLKSSSYGITDLLSAVVVKKIYLEENNIKHEYRMKIQPETKKMLISIYNSNINSGLNKEKYDLNKVNCFFMDFSCHIFKPIFVKKVRGDFIQSIENKLNIDNYDIAHPKEFKNWHKQLNKEDGSTNNLKSPGSIYYGEK